MDTTSDPNLVLDENGVCNYCHTYDELVEKTKQHIGNQTLEDVFNQIKEEGKDKEYDCILGISGGVDSCYIAYLAKQYGLRVLAVHVDAGWNSELAVQNIEKLCKKLDYDLHTVVIDWPTMKELQRAYLFSGLGNQDVPQDHCFLAGVWKFAKQYDIKYVLNGYNLATEGILSTAYQHQASDWRSIRGVYRKCGRGKISLKKYPHVNLFTTYSINYGVNGLKQIYPLNYINYSKKEAIKTLEREFGWKYYGGKHYESRFTKFFQEVYLPQKLGWEKRRDHLSSLIVGGEMTREEALEEIAIPPSTEAEMREETEYVLKKLDISDEEWQKILKLPNKRAEDYPSNAKLMAFLKKMKRKVVRK
jgi:N-acetyl sugar amidotransferase